jgi:hypothetical protein
MKHPENNERTAKAARDGAGIDAAMRRAVAKAVSDRRKLGLPIVASDIPGSRGAAHPSK